MKSTIGRTLIAVASAVALGAYAPVAVVPLAVGAIAWWIGSKYAGATSERVLAAASIQAGQAI